MTTHYLHLHPEPFELIRSGQKTLESRLFDEKRQSYRVGDELIFTNRGNEAQRIHATITGFHRAATFEELFAKKELSGKFGPRSFSELLDEISIYYSKAEQEEGGVVAIEFTINHIVLS